MLRYALRPVLLHHLCQVWQIIVSKLRGLGIDPSCMFGFAAFCGDRCIEPNEVSDEDLEEFLKERRERGEPEPANRVQEFRLRGAFRKLKEADPGNFNPPISTDTDVCYRRQEWKVLAPDLKEQFERLRTRGNVRWSDRTVINQQNRMLRYIGKLRANGVEVRDIRQIADKRSYELLRRVGFGMDETYSPREHVDFLYFARLIAFVFGLAAELVWLNKEIKRVKVPGGISEARVKAAIALDDSILSKLLSHCLVVLDEAAHEEAHSLVIAQAALAVLLCYLASQPPKHLYRAIFVHGYSDGGDDAALAEIIIRGRTVKLLPEQERAIAALRRTFPLVWAKDGAPVFAKTSGAGKSRQALAYGVKCLGEAIGIKLTLDPLHLASIYGMLKDGMPYAQVCHHVGWKEVNVFARQFRPLIELAGQKVFTTNVARGG